MGTYTSKLDMGTMKMALVASEAIKDFSIHYHDDCDFYLANHSLVTQNTGSACYIGRVRKDIVRQVTHNAYGLRTASLNALISEHITDLFKDGKVYIRYIIRNGGMRKGLPFHRERLNELYLLPLAKIKEALYGVNSVVPEWRAENLEASDYMKIVASEWNKLSATLVSKGYGYHALMNVSFNEPVRPVNGYCLFCSGLWRI